MRARSWARKHYYQVLGVGEAATEEELKRAYRQLALRFHPDRNPDDPQAEARFKEISEAYAALVDPAKRREYDAFRRSQTARESFSGHAWTREDLFRDLLSNPRSANIFEDLSREFSRLGLRFDDRFFRDIFFGGRGIFFGKVVVFGPFGARRMVFRPGREAAIPSFSGFLGWFGRELRAVLTAPAKGARRLLALASGHRGADLVRSLELTSEEARAGGRKRVGIQRDRRGEELLVKIPPGVRQGMRLRLRGKGVNGGDLYLRVEISG